MSGSAGPTSEPLSVAVVGAGPRGVIMTERLCANADDIAPGRPLVVHVMDPYPPGGGRVWRQDQVRCLLMNTVAGDISVFTDPTVTCVGPIRRGPTQYEWARDVAAGAVTGQCADVVAEAEAMQAWSYASRAFQGAYLSWSLDHIVATAPPQVEVRFHRSSVCDLHELADGRQRVHLADGASLVVDSVVLAQGHYDVHPTEGQDRLAAFAERHHLRYIGPSSPGEVDLSTIAAGEPVLMRGLGLNFYDYITLLSAGRGGTFGRRPDGSLHYRPSGREPILYAGSGRGVPYTARAEVRQEVVPRYQPVFLDAEVIASLRRHAGTGTLDFRADLWPYVAKETGWVYYRHLLSRGPLADAAALERFTTEYPRLAAGSRAEARLVADLVPAELRWDWDKLDRPTAGMAFADRSSYSSWVSDRIRADHDHAVRGPAGSAVKAAAAMLRDLRDEVRQVVSHRGLAGQSYRRDVEGWFSGLNNYAASGPPARRVEELGALVEAGVVRFVGPAVRVVADDDTHAFSADSPSVAQAPLLARTLIESHLPATDLRRVRDPLLRALLDRGEVRPHVIADRDGEDYVSGGLDITEGDQRLVDAAGEAHPARYSFGPPVESVQWVTAIGARPHVNSRTLLQADVIARCAMRPVDRSAQVRANAA